MLNFSVSIFTRRPETPQNFFPQLQTPFVRRLWILSTESGNFLVTGLLFPGQQPSLTQ